MSDITSERIRDMRISLGMTQDDLAVKCGYKHRSSINKIEKDAREVTLDKIKDIALALKVSPDYLLGWSDDPHAELIERLYTKYDIIITEIARNCDRDTLITYAMKLMDAAKDSPS